MGEELLRVLRMVAEGKVGPEEAVGLLEALEPPAAAADQAAPPLVLFAPPAPPSVPGRRVRIHLETSDGSAFDIAQPVRLARHLVNVLPERARKALQQFGVDIDAVLAHVDTATPAGELIAAEMSEGSELKISVEE